MKIDWIWEKDGKEIGETKNLLIGTSNLNTKEFAEYCELCRRFILDYYNIWIEDPNPNWKDNLL